MSIRRTIITSYHFQKKEFEANIKTDKFKSLKFCCIQEEMCPDTGKMHHQGYLEFDTKVTIKFIKELVGDNSTHIETKKLDGTPLQGAEYCGYNNGGLTPKNKAKADERIINKWDYIEYGTFGWQKPGERSDLNKVAEMIKEGKELRDIVENCTSTYIRNYRGIERAMDILREPELKIEEKQVIVHIGESGQGKTHCIWEKHGIKNVYSKPSGLWWNGYVGQPVVIIDEIYKDEYRVKDLLAWLDKYPIQVPIKGGFKHLTATTIYITSNQNINDWFTWNCEEHYIALLRRIKKILKFNTDIDDPVEITIEEEKLIKIEEGINRKKLKQGLIKICEKMTDLFDELGDRL